jgi:hypothetical protein
MLIFFPQKALRHYLLFIDKKDSLLKISLGANLLYK